MFRLVNVVAASLILSAGSALALEPDQGAARTASPGVEFSMPPQYAPGPPVGGPATGTSQEPVLVPLPPGAWAAMSGLVGLALLAMWRKHRLREE